jgi:hypothetical protein
VQDQDQKAVNLPFKAGVLLAGTHFLLFLHQPKRRSGPLRTPMAARLESLRALYQRICLQASSLALREACLVAASHKMHFVLVGVSAVYLLLVFRMSISIKTIHVRKKFVIFPKKGRGRSRIESPGAFS